VRRAVPLVAVIAALLAAGCSHYGFSASVRTHIRSIAIPILANETLEYGAEQDLTDALINEFTNDNTLRVVGADEADSILRGAVVLYERPVVAYDAGGNPIEYKVRVVARLSYEDLTKNAVVWEGDVEGWALYSAAGGVGDFTTEAEARSAAFQQIAQDVLSKTVQGW
jgi:hypothetical protein